MTKIYLELIIIDEYYYLLFAEVQSLTWSDRPHSMDVVQLMMCIKGTKQNKADTEGQAI